MQVRSVTKKWKLTEKGKKLTWAGMLRNISSDVFFGYFRLISRDTLTFVEFESRPDLFEPIEEINSDTNKSIEEIYHWFISASEREDIRRFDHYTVEFNELKRVYVPVFVRGKEWEPSNDRFIFDTYDIALKFCTIAHENLTSIPPLDIRKSFLYETQRELVTSLGFKMLM